MQAVVKTRRAPGGEVRTVPTPKPKDDEVLVRVRASSVCGTDVHLWVWNPWAEARVRRAARSPGLRRSSLGLPSGGRGLPYGGAVSGPEASSPEAEAEKIVRVLSERATAAKAEAVWAEPLTSTWSGRAIAALVIPALILLLVWLL